MSTTMLPRRKRRTTTSKPLIVLLVPVTLIAWAVLYASFTEAAAQHSGEYLTEKEIEWVREFQEIDARTSVFLYVADRRLKVITGAKESAKELETWGPPPTGAKQEMLEAYRRAMNELMDKIEDAYDRNPKAPALKKAVDLLHSATERQLKQLEALRATLTEHDELTALDAAIDSAHIAHEAEIKGPSTNPKQKKKK